MPQQDMSKMIGHSPSPAIEKASQRNADVQKPVTDANSALSQQWNKHPENVKNGGK